jgi:hypothetical protein
MVKESRLRNSWSEVGIAEFPFSEPTIFPELPPFWFLFGGKSLILICRRLPFLSCRNRDCCLIIASNGAENCAFRNSTPNTLPSAVVTKGFPARELKLSVAVLQVELFYWENWI